MLRNLRKSFKHKGLLWLMAILTVTSYAFLPEISGQPFMDEKMHDLPKDTLKALVIDDDNPLINEIKDMPADQVFTLIDSLLDADAIPVEVIREINDYAESRLLEHDFYVSLTSYYDNSIYPANNFYQDWNTEKNSY